MTKKLSASKHTQSRKARRQFKSSSQCIRLQPADLCESDILKIAELHSRSLEKHATRSFEPIHSLLYADERIVSAKSEIDKILRSFEAESRSNEFQLSSDIVRRYSLRAVGSVEDIRKLPADCHGKIKQGPEFSEDRIIAYKASAESVFYIDKNYMTLNQQETAFAEMYANLILHIPPDIRNNNSVYVDAGINSIQEIDKDLKKESKRNRQSKTIEQQMKIYARSIRFPLDIVLHYVRDLRMDSDSLAKRFQAQPEDLSHRIQDINNLLGISVR